MLTTPPAVELRSPLGRSDTSTGSSLDAWVNHHWRDGVQIETLEPLCLVVVRTRNTVYEVAIVCGAHGDVLVRGGRYFPDWTPARLAGSTLGGSLLKQWGIHVGWRMELQVDERRIVTSRVHAVAAPASPAPTCMTSPS